MMRFPVNAACAALLCLALAPRPANALVKLDASPDSVALISSKHAKWDTVVIMTYLYNSGDTTFVNKGKTPLLYLDVRIDTISAAKHFLAPGDSLEPFTGKMIKDTLTVLKTAFAVVTWIDPNKSFQSEPAVANLRVATLYADMHPKHDTVRVAGCPIPTVLEHPFFRSPSEGKVKTTLFNVIGRPVWMGILARGAFPAEAGLSEGAYLMVQGSTTRLFRVPAR
jgi:hypothetical protein